MKFSPILFVTIVFLSTLTSCTMPRVYVDSKLKTNATEYVVEGRQNAFKRSMTFGKFEFTNVKRGWVTTSSKNGFFKKTNEAKSKMSFKIKYKRLEAETFTASQTAVKGLVFGKIEIEDDMKDVFSGMIQIKDGKTWDFFIKNTNNIDWDVPATGYATDGDKRIEVKDVRKAEGKTPKLMPDTIFGYTLSIDKEPVAVVETIAGKGGIWMKKGLDTETEFVVANLAAALLLRPDLSKEHRQ